MMNLTDSKEAIEKFGSSYSRWYKNGVDPKAIGDFAVQRINSGVFRPEVQACELNKNMSFFAIGSCFARGIEKRLRSMELNILSFSNRYDSFVRANDKVSQLGFTNKYSTHSILNQLRWSSGEREFDERDYMLLQDGMYADPHANPTLKFVDAKRTAERRSIMNEVFAGIFKADVVFITLGLTEVWYDTLTENWLNMTPFSDVLKKDTGRYKWCFTNMTQNLANLEEVYTLLKKHGMEGVKLVVTVSPVPLLATFSGMDVGIANMISKSTLRTCVNEFVHRHDDVFYFPSFEMAMMSSRDLVWEDDGRHVQGSFVINIMDHFENNFFKQTSGSTW